jgi:hypothetical protein
MKQLQLIGLVTYKYIPYFSEKILTYRINTLIINRTSDAEMAHKWTGTEAMGISVMKNHK